MIFNISLSPYYYMKLVIKIFHHINVTKHCHTSKYSGSCFISESNLSQGKRQEEVNQTAIKCGSPYLYLLWQIQIRVTYLRYLIPDPSKTNGAHLKLNSHHIYYIYLYIYVLKQLSVTYTSHIQINIKINYNIVINTGLTIIRK